MKKLLFTTLCLLAFAGSFGQKWEQVGNGLVFPNGAPTKAINIGKILAVSPTTIFAYGSNTFIVSRDAGATWENIAPTYNFNINVFHFFDSDNGIALGDSGISSNRDGLILKTHDGGKTWYQMPPPAAAPPFTYWQSGSFKDSNDFVIVGSGDIYGTKNAGKTYKRISLGGGWYVGPLKE